MADPVYLARLLAAIGVALALGLCATAGDVSAPAMSAPAQHLHSH